MTSNLSSGIAAYRSSRFEEAITIFLETLEDNRLDWWSWFYLGMSYSKVGRLESAYRIMQVIWALSSDATVKSEARNTISDLEDELFGVRRGDSFGEMRLSA